MVYLSLSSLSLLSSFTLYLAGRCKAEPPNPLYQDHMNDATAVYNFTLFIIPYPKDDVQALTGGYPLLSPPFPVPEGRAPLVLQFGKRADIRQSLAQIPELMAAAVGVPFVDRLKNGKTPFYRSKYTFGDQIIPATVASLVEGYRNELATFTPPHAAYASDEEVRSFQVKQTVVPPPLAPVGGPGTSVPIFDATFTPLSTSETPEYPQSVYEGLTNTHIFGYGPECGSITSFYNYTFTKPTFVLGDITLYGGPVVEGVPIHFRETKHFTNVPGITVTVAEIGGTFPAIPCANFA